MIVRRLDQRDLDDLRFLWRQTWRETYGPRLGPEADAIIAASLAGDAIRAMFADDSVCLLAIEDHAVSGSICFAERGRTTFVWGMYVRPDRQRQGIGTVLMRQAIARLMTSDRVELSTVDPAARAFYDSLGFAAEGPGEITLFPGVTVPATRLVLTLDRAALTPTS